MLTFPSAHDILLAHSLLACKYMNTKMLYLSQALGQKRAFATASSPNA